MAKHYFIYACEQSYEGLHGMFDMDMLYLNNLSQAEDVGLEMSIEVQQSYSCIEEEYERDLFSELKIFDEDEQEEYRNTEEYAEQIEEYYLEGVLYYIYEITAEGEKHLSDMEDSPNAYVDFLKNGWLKEAE